MPTDKKSGKVYENRKILPEICNHTFTKTFQLCSFHNPWCILYIYFCFVFLPHVIPANWRITVLLFPIRTREVQVHTCRISFALSIENSRLTQKSNKLFKTINESICFQRYGRDRGLPMMVNRVVGFYLIHLPTPTSKRKKTKLNQSIS